MRTLSSAETGRSNGVVSDLFDDDGEIDETELLGVESFGSSFGIGGGRW